MEEDIAYYIIWREYSEKERPNETPQERRILYGWTTSKSTVKAFFEQRDPNKYFVKKMYSDEIDEYSDLSELFMETEPARDKQIQYVQIKSVTNDEWVTLFITPAELEETKKAIVKYFKEFPSLAVWDSTEFTLLILFKNLNFYYGEALDYIGFHPIEFNALYDSVEDMYGDSYNVDGEYPQESYDCKNSLRMNSVSESIDNYLFSLEGFMIILGGDM